MVAMARMVMALAMIVVVVEMAQVAECREVKWEEVTSSDYKWGR